MAMKWHFSHRLLVVELNAAPALTVSVQEADFEVAALQRQLITGTGQEGAEVTFTGHVRKVGTDQPVDSMLLEHYPGMTENSITDILRQASARWPLLAASVVHRVGRLQAGDQIVWVGVTSAHREAAFNACEFVMDYLKNEAPFWKKEQGPRGGQWVEARHEDRQRAARWDSDATK